MQLQDCNVQICGENRVFVGLVPSGLLLPRAAKSSWLKRFAEALLRLNRRFCRDVLSSSFEVPF